MLWLLNIEHEYSSTKAQHWALANFSVVNRYSRRRLAHCSICVLVIASLLVAIGQSDQLIDHDRICNLTRATGKSLQESRKNRHDNVPNFVLVAGSRGLRSLPLTPTVKRARVYAHESRWTLPCETCPSLCARITSKPYPVKRARVYARESHLTLPCETCTNQYARITSIPHRDNSCECILSYPVPW